MRPRQKFPRQDDLTKEWFFDGKWYDEYPGKEVEDHNEAWERYLDQKYDEMRDEQILQSRPKKETD